MGSTIATDANGIKTLVPSPSGIGGDLLLDNDAQLSALRTSDKVLIDANTGGRTTNAANIAANDIDIAANAANIVLNDIDIAANAANIALNDAEILALQIESIAYGVTNQAVVGDGVTDDRAAIVSALAQAVTDGKWLSFPPGTYLIESDIVFTVPVLFTGGILRLAAGVTATFNQPYLNPSRQQCFDEQGRLPNQAGGIVVALTSPQDTVYPQDWGAMADGSGSTNQIPIQQAIDAVTYGASANKAGTVIFPSGKYQVNDAIFVGYDFRSNAGLISDWTNRTYIADSSSANAAVSPQYRKNRVILRGEGYAWLLWKGSTTAYLNKYMLYYCARGNTEGHTIIENIRTNGNIGRCRGCYVARANYMDRIQGLTVKATRFVGLDWIDCFGSALVGFHAFEGFGIGLRTHNANGCLLENIRVSGIGHLDSHWPPPDEVSDATVLNVSSFSDVKIETAVADRSAIVHNGNGSVYNSINVESCKYASPMDVTVASLRTCTRTDHGFLQTEIDGDANAYPIWFNGAAMFVASVTSTAVFVTDANGVNGSNKPVHRRATAITQDNPARVSLKNHGFATGQRVKVLVGGAGMVELDDTWFTITVVDDDAFTLDGEDSSGHAVSNGSEYFQTGAAAMYIDAQSSLVINSLRLESNNIVQTKVILEDQSLGVMINGLLVDDGNEAGCDWAVFMRNRANANKIYQVIGNGIDRATLAISHDGATRYSHANSLEGTALVSDPSQGQLELIGVTAGRAGGNYIEGQWTPFYADDGDNTPSVWGNSGNSRGTMVKGAWLVVPASFGVTDITNFDDGNDGDTLDVFFLVGTATVKHDVLKIDMTGNADVTPAVNTALHFRNVGGVWYEV